MVGHAGDVWIEYGFLSYVEGVEPVSGAPEGGGSMQGIGDRGDVGSDESVVVVNIQFESRAYRDEVTASVQDDSVDQEQFGGVKAFDPQWMTSGSVKVIVSSDS